MSTDLTQEVRGCGQHGYQLMQLNSLFCVYLAAQSKCAPSASFITNHATTTRQGLKLMQQGCKQDSLFYMIKFLNVQ